MRKGAFALGWSMLVVPMVPATAASSAPATAERAALMAPLAARALLLDVATAGDRLVAVGVHGIILVSDDRGRTWSQVEVPTEEMLTGLSFYDARNGWAVGHGGTVLRTSDGGTTWEHVPVPVSEETSFLDVFAVDVRHVIVIGAFEACLESRDGGHTWQPRTPLGPKDEMDKVHLNRITCGSSGTLYLAGEYGTLAASDDKGSTWRILDSPYEGSFYGLHELEGGRLLAHGLRGHVFVSDDGGASWSPVPMAHSVLLMTAAQARDGTLAIAGQGGHLFISRDGGDSFMAHRPEELTDTAEIVFADDGALVCLGTTGVHRLEVP